MDIVSELRKCGLKIIAYVDGVPENASGILYTTPEKYIYNYAITAKHLFVEDCDISKPINVSKVTAISIKYSDNGIFKTLEYICKKDIQDKLIPFNQDLVLIKVNKNPNIIFPLIVVSDDIDNAKDNFFSFAISKANEKDLQRYHYFKNDSTTRRFKLDIGNASNTGYLKGMSGAGILSSDEPILYGIVSSYPNAGFWNETIDCTRISFKEINSKLESYKYAQLKFFDDKDVKLIRGNVVDINQAIINGVRLNLELARKRLKTDLFDDWFRDPLYYIDLLNHEYILNQLEEYFYDNKDYKPSKAEQVKVLIFL